MRCSLVMLLLFVFFGADGQDSKQVKKLSPQLENHLRTADNSTGLFISVSLAITDTALIRRFRLQAIHPSFAFYKATLTATEIEALATMPAVQFINQLQVPIEELNTGSVDYTLNRIRKSQQAFSFITGDAINVGIKERQFDSTDIDFKGRTVTTGLQAAQQSSHASLMATIVGGGGNTSPDAKGVAISTGLASLDFANLFPESNALYTQKALSVINHSYGTTIENFYGNEAAAYDLSAVANPSVLQVFSAGNSGAVMSTTGPYTGIPAMANLTGNFKQSKNTLSVAALDSMGNAMAAASKGPAYDGRLKPELSAYGEDGSSGAAALVSGTAALVQQAYKRLNTGLPPSHLTKAVLINSADDVGAKGIDYSTGYGSLNAFAAVQTVLQGRYFQSSASEGETKTFALTVPAGMAQLKLTLCWTDASAAAGTSKGLVNDLDALLLNTTTLQTWQPWVLNSKPVKDSLLLPPQRRQDTLNNVEQITVDAPPAGIYQVQIKGRKVAAGVQSFAVVYSMDTANRFAWDHPSVGDAFAANTKQVLRWSTTISGTGTISYSYDGLQWQTLVSSVDLAASAFAWITPDTTAALRLRMTVDAQNFLSDTISINRLLQLSVGFNCTDSLLLYWNKLSAAGYRLYRLGEKYLEPFVVTADTSVTLNKAQQPSLHYAVAPVSSGREGVRSTTVLYPATGVGCYLSAFYLQAQSSTTATFTATLGTLVGLRQVELQKQTNNVFTTIQTVSVSASTNLFFTDVDLKKGESRYRLRLVLQNGAVVFSTIEPVYNLAGGNVYVYPNPVRQSEALRIISTEPGRYTIRIINSAGVEVYRQAVNNSYLTIPTIGLSVGLYAIWVMDNQGKPTIQKLLVY